MLTRRSLIGAGVGQLAVANAVAAPALAGRGRTAEPLVSSIEQYFEASRARIGLPGSAVALVQGGRTIMLRGFGVKALGHPAPMDADTMFSLASNSKAFTAAAIGTIVDEGLVRWDDRLADLVPTLRFADPQITRQATVRDMLAHRCGVDNDYMNNLWSTRAEAIATLPHQPTRIADFRRTFLYSDIVYAIADPVIQATTGEGWGAALKRRLAGPLGMASTTFTSAELGASANLSLSHEHDLDGRLSRDPITGDGWWSMDFIAPAGAVNSTIRDMSRWMTMLLARGSIGGRRLLAPQTVAEMMTPQIPYSDTDFPASKPLGYGLGLAMDIYRGLKLVWHTGRFRGHHSMMMLCPELDLGLFVFTNASVGSDAKYTTAGGLWLIDRLTDGPMVDHQGLAYATYQSDLAEKRARRTTLAGARKAGTGPSLPLEAYAGRYLHPIFGSWEVAYDGIGLSIVKPDARQTYIAPMTHWQDDVFSTAWSDPEIEYRPSEFAAFLLEGRRVAGIRLTRPIWRPDAAPVMLRRDP